jgi:hypothetical protein
MVGWTLEAAFFSSDSLVAAQAARVMAKAMTERQRAIRQAWINELEGFESAIILKTSGSGVWIYP